MSHRITPSVLLNIMNRLDGVIGEGVPFETGAMLMEVIDHPKSN